MRQVSIAVARAWPAKMGGTTHFRFLDPHTD